VIAPRTVRDLTDGGEPAREHTATRTKRAAADDERSNDMERRTSERRYLDRDELIVLAQFER
jgi:hypothetical protein